MRALDMHTAPRAASLSDDAQERHGFLFNTRELWKSCGTCLPKATLNDPRDFRNCSWKPQTCPKLARRPDAPLGPNSTNMADLGQMGRMWPQSGKARPKWAKFGQHLFDIGLLEQLFDNLLDNFSAILGWLRSSPRVPFGNVCWNTFAGAGLRAVRPVNKPGRGMGGTAARALRGGGGAALPCQAPDAEPRADACRRCGVSMRGRERGARYALCPAPTAAGQADVSEAPELPKPPPGPPSCQLGEGTCS